MFMNPRPTNPIVNLLQRVGLALAAAVFAVSAFVLAIGAVAFGLIFALGVTLWALLRGKKPGGIKFNWQQRPFGRSRSAPNPAAKGEIVDVQVREVPESAQKPPRGRDDLH